MASIVLIIAGSFTGAIISWIIAVRVKENHSKGFESELIEAKALLKAKETAFEQSKNQMMDSYMLVAKEAFKSAVKEADEEKEASFTGATEKLQQDLLKFTEEIQRFERESIERNTALKSEIQQVTTLGIQLSEDTKSLTNALKADSQAQGAWGELVLENLLQSMGFVEKRDYVKQLSETSTDGKRKRTDFIINLPDNRQVIIDSKVSLKAWDRFVNAENEEAAENAMKDHCESIAKHAKKLAAIRYQDMESVNSVEFVLMFVPLESAFGAAMRQSPELYMDLAGNVNVKVVTGATIVTALLLIKEIWKRENQTRNQIELVNRAGALHDKVVLFLESFEEVGFEINQARNAFETARTRLISGDGNVIRQTEMLRELGAKTKKELREKSGVRKLAEEANEGR